MMGALHAACAVLLCAAGFAICAAALVVLHDMDVRRARLRDACSWLVMACVGAWLAVLPVLAGDTGIVPVTLLALAHVSVLYGNLDALRERAVTPPPRTRVVSVVHDERGTR